MPCSLWWGVRWTVCVHMVITLGHPGYTPTDLHHLGRSRCAGTDLVPCHRQQPCWTTVAIVLYTSFYTIYIYIIYIYITLEALNTPGTRKVVGWAIRSFRCSWWVHLLGAIMFDDLNSRWTSSTGVPNKRDDQMSTLYPKKHTSLNRWLANSNL